MLKFIDPINSLASKLLELEKPARYTGGEYGSIAKKDAVLRMAVAFPDLYEIGMSNQAFRILYNALNGIEGISCDRAFAPAPDFEALLEKEGLPLYGLDTGIALNSTDVLCFTLGYELGITGVLTILKSSFIPLRTEQRGGEDPIVIMGGPCVSNPLPYSPFVDAFWIGEAEAGFFDLSGKLLELKKKGGSRGELLEEAVSHSHIWVPGKTRVLRAVANDFGRDPGSFRGAAVFPVPSIKTVQHHGALEIMRGCPNGCRFCHAGIWYRPMRQKRADLILKEVEEFVSLGGYREISLSSLSSGDYCFLDELIGILNDRYNSRHISFQLPSLRVSGFSLSLLNKISKVRKSGLTFAVETPQELRQLSINKRVSLEDTVSILEEAKKQGWRGAKFYFMIGLPLDFLPNGEEEADMADFITEAGRRTRSHFHINLGTFVPKAHTPYQWAAQINEEEAWKKLNYIRDILRPLGHKLSIHDPFTARIEGFIARGDKRAGELVEKAFLRGCRLDAWSEFIQKDIWRDLFADEAALCAEILGEKDLEMPLPWRVIDSGTAEAYLKKEWKKSQAAQFTPPCINNCTDPCGICPHNADVVQNSIHIQNSIQVQNTIRVENSIHDKNNIQVKNSIHIEQNPGEDAVPAKTQKNQPTLRMLFSFSKQGKGIYISHLGLIELFAMAFVRSGIAVQYTEGYNPLVRMEFASPVSIGINCGGEAASVDLQEGIGAGEFIRRLNKTLPEGFIILKAELFVIPAGTKKHSLASLLWGFRYGDLTVEAGGEKSLKAGIKAGGAAALTRTTVLAKDGDGGYGDYFAAYRRLYK